MTNESAAVTTDESKYIKSGIRQAIYCETYGLLTVLFIFALLDELSDVYKFPLPITLGIGGLYVWAFLSGGIAGKIVYRLGLKSFAIWIIGIVLAWSNILALGLALNLFSAPKTNDSGNTIFYYILMLIAWSIVVGFIPVLILGLWWARQMRNGLGYYKEELLSIISLDPQEKV